MIKDLIIKQCKKHGYELIGNAGWVDCLRFVNSNVRKEFQVFDVVVDKDLESVRMAIIMDLGSWNEALDTDLNNTEEILKTIDLWISEESLKKLEEILEE